MVVVLVGLDDTDNETSRGTGHLARMLSAECERRGMRPCGVTRHQFLVDARIPYTSHNSGACVAVEAESVDQMSFAFDFVAGQAAPGSDPGVCVALGTDVSRDMMAFGWRATREVLEIDDAMAAAAAASIALRPLGGDGQGVIGALGSVALRADGNEGRFVDLPGLRALPERVSAAALADLGIRVAHPSDGRVASRGDVYETLGWVRPRVAAGAPTLPVAWSDEHDAWVPIDRKKQHSTR